MITILGRNRIEKSSIRSMIKPSDNNTLIDNIPNTAATDITAIRANFNIFFISHTPIYIISQVIKKPNDNGLNFYIIFDLPLIFDTTHQSHPYGLESQSLEGNVLNNVHKLCNFPHVSMHLSFHRL